MTPNAILLVSKSVELLYQEYFDSRGTTTFGRFHGNIITPKQHQIIYLVGEKDR